MKLTKSWKKDRFRSISKICQKKAINDRTSWLWGVAKEGPNFLTYYLKKVGHPNFESYSTSKWGYFDDFANSGTG